MLFLIIFTIILEARAFGREGVLPMPPLPWYGVVAGKQLPCQGLYFPEFCTSWWGMALSPDLWGVCGSEECQAQAWTTNTSYLALCVLFSLTSASGW